MFSTLYIPTYPLNQFIENFFYYTSFHAEHPIDRFLPDGNVQLIFDLQDESKAIYDNESLQEIQRCSRVWFSGFRTKPISIPSGSEGEMLIITFHKGRAYPFLAESIACLKNIVVDAELVFKHDILELRDKLREPHHAHQKFKLLEKELLKQYRSHLKENPFVDFAIRTLLYEPHQRSIKTIASQAGYSQKHLIKLFKDHVGVTLKDFLKVIRFQRAVQAIEARQAVDWVSIAYDCGFYDQSHFIADFKSFSGFTPTDYVKLKGEIMNYVPLGGN